MSRTVRPTWLIPVTVGMAREDGDDFIAVVTTASLVGAFRSDETQTPSGLGRPMVALQDAATTDPVKLRASMATCRCGIQTDSSCARTGAGMAPVKKAKSASGASSSIQGRNTLGAFVLASSA